MRSIRRFPIPHSPARTGLAVLAGLVVLLGGVAVAVSPSGVSYAEPSAQEDPPPLTELRVGYLATGHRSIGLIEGTGATAVSVPFLGPGPAHFDDEVTSTAGVVAWVSRRQSELAQLWVRRTTGEVTAVTEDPVQVAGEPAISPDGTRIAFEQTRTGVNSWRDVFVVGVDGTGLRQVTDGVGDYRHPTWSPDGTGLAFERSDGGVPQIWRVPVDVPGPAFPITGRPEGAGEPAWDPDPVNDRIAYTVGPGSVDTRRIHLMNSVGGDDRPLLDDLWDSHSPSWSPDGDTLVFLSRTTGTDGTRGPIDLVYTGQPRDDWCPCEAVLRLAEDRQVDHPTWYVPTPGAEPELLVGRTTAPDRYTVTLQDIRPDATDPRDLGLTVLREDPGAETNPDLLWQPVNGDPWNARPDYSPDGRRIVVNRFETVDGQRVSRLWIVGADGADPTLVPLADRGATDVETDPAWSPQGDRVAYASATPGQPSRIVVADPTTGERLLTVPAQGDLSDSQPAWSPDGTRLAFVRGRPEGAGATSHVWTVDASDGGDPLDLTDVGCPDCTGPDYGPTFSPDGTRIAFGRGTDGLLVTDVSGADCQVLAPQTPGATCSGPLTGPDDGPHRPRDVAWSPDGSRLAYNARRYGEAASPEYVKTYDFDTAEHDGLTWELPPGRQRKPTWQRAVDVATEVSAPPAPVRVDERTSFTLTVTDRGPVAAVEVRLDLQVPAGVRVTALEPEVGSCDLDPPGCSLGAIGLGNTVEVRVELTGVAPGTYPLEWTVGGWSADSRPSDNTATTPVTVLPAPPPTTPPTTPPPTTPPPTTPPPTTPPPTTPPPTVSPPPSTGLRITVRVEPRPGYVGGRITVTYTVRNIGEVPATGVRITPSLPPGIPVRSRPPGCVTTCPVADLPPGATRTLTFVLVPRTATSTTVRGSVVGDGGLDDTDTAVLRVLQPRIVAVPEIGPPGFVTSIRGVDFPPGVRVRLTWDVGITAAADPAVPARNGTFAAQMLVLPRDELGPRVVSATGAGFGTVRTDFRVVLPAQQPPGLVRRSW
ncbi:hypothetical protein [Micromonospora sp. SH-82]|uniref:hypothetical protein n=1 Tax=Micromonospora sp. SH-82 TaxID=3132938 RepID=UPI003EB6E75F